MDWFNLDNWFYSVLPQLMRDWIANASGYQTYYIDQDGKEIELQGPEDWYRFILMLADELESVPKDQENLDYRDMDKRKAQLEELRKKKQRIFTLLGYNIDAFWD